MKTFTKLALATSLAFCFTAPAMADEYKDTLDLLLQKGIITQQEYNTKIEAHTERLENKQFNAARIDKDLRDNNNSRFTKANDEINALEKEMNSGYSLPVMDMMN